MPAFIARYADGCLTSIRRQTVTDLEIIAVDDGSPDDCGAIIDRHARADDRIVAVHLPRSHGVGHARNEAVARAARLRERHFRAAWLRDSAVRSPPGRGDARRTDAPVKAPRVGPAPHVVATLAGPRARGRQLARTRTS